MSSFSSEAKNEICTVHEGDCCIMAELCALTLVCATFSLNANGSRLKYNTEHMTVAKRIFKTVTHVLKLDAGVEVKDNQMKKNHSYTVNVENASLLIDILGIEGNFFTGAMPPKYLYEKECCKVAMLRGAFLGSGTISNPKKHYHLEFVVNYLPFAEIIQDILIYFKIKSKIIHRRQSFVVYLNEGDNIVALLAMIGAHSSILNLENVRILKEMRNNVNRAVNCETANINKTVNAAMTQVNSINIIQKHMGIEKLSEPLQEAAYLRLENKEASLQELCELCGTTKSGMNHRLRKINTIASALKKEE